MDEPLGKADAGKRISGGDTFVFGEGVHRPLWGLRLKTNYLHDGSVTSFDDAIAAHGGEGSYSRDAYNALSAEKQAQVDAWLGSL